MKVSIQDLPADIIASYEASARARGISLDAFMREHLIQNAPPAPSGAQGLTAEEWEKALDECFDSIPEIGPLLDDAFERVSWYR